jgi:hypothetical protein
MNVDDLLMLEAPKPPPAPKPERTRTHSNLDPQKPLPAIPASPVDGQGQRSQRETGGDQSSRPVDDSQGQEQQDNDAFFMTQVFFSFHFCCFYFSFIFLYLGSWSS